MVERLGPTLGESLSNPTPWTSSHCGRVGCLPCKSKEGSCKKVGVTYQWTCMRCAEEGKKAVYLGETARSLWDRTLEHIKNLENRTEGSALWKQWSQFHPSDEAPEFTVKCTGSYKMSTERQIREALAIDAGDYDRLMNSKKEYGANCVVRQVVVFRDTVVVEQNEQNESEDDETIVRNELQSQEKSSKEEESTFISQYSQRVKKKKGKGAPGNSPMANRVKRLREVGCSDDTNRSGSPTSTASNCFKREKTPMHRDRD